MSNQIVITSGAKLRDLDDVIIGTDGILSSVAFNVANGVPKLDENGKILVSQLPNSVMEFKGVWNAATNTPTLVNGTGNAGDVWLCNVAGTVNFGAGPIAFAVGDYAVYTGSVWARSSGATGTVTSVGVSRDGNALTITGSPVTSSGTINLGFSGDNTQYINGAGNLTTFPTLITSIGLTMPAAFNVSNSPLTANGTIGVAAAGYASQYIRGDGTLADFPTSGGGGSSVSYYFNGGTSQGTIGGTTYYEMSKTADTGTGVDFNKTGDGFIVAFLTDANDPNLLQIPAGNWDFEIYASMSANGGTPELYAELYKYDGTTFTLIATSSHEILYDGVNLNLYSFATAVPQTSLTVTDRLAIKLYADNSGGKTTTIHTQDSHLCQVITTFSTGLTALNGLTAQVQYFATGTSGNDFNIVSSVATHTFNIPSASATARGLITTGAQTIAGSKTITGTTTFTGGPILSDTNLTYANSGYTLVLQSPTLSVNRTVTLPNGTGTLALTSDISYPVTSVFGRTGAVVATSGDYNSDQVTEGTTNLYFTNTRARTAISLTTTGSTGASTYNNSTGVLNIPNYADQYVGTVTSVDMSVPTGLSVSGNPITTSGTLAVTLTAGYSIPTTANQSTWTTAYNRSLTSAAVTGTTTKTLTLNQQDGGTITASWTDINTDAVTSVFGRTGAVVATDGDYTLTLLGDVTITTPTTGQVLKYNGTVWINDTDANTGTVTSVAMTVPTGLSIAGSPITSSGTLAVTLSSGYVIPTQTTLDGFVTLATTQTVSGAKTFSETVNILKGTRTLSIGAVGYANHINIDSGVDFSFNYNNSNTTGGLALYSGTTTQKFYVNSLGEITVGSYKATAIADTYISSAATWNAKQNAITLTTTGTSGAATLVGSTLNIPNYSPDLSGYVTLTTTQTISGFKTFNAPIAGGSGDYTNVTSAPLKIVGSNDIWRIPHTSTSLTQSGVYNYEVGKHVYWGEVADGGDYYFRGRNFKVTDDAVNFSVTTYGLGYLRGNLGIGTTSVNTPFSPEIALQLGIPTNVLSLFTIAGTQGSIYFADGTSGTAVNKGIIEYFHATDYMSFTSNGAEALKLLSDQSALFLGDVKIQNGQVDLILNTTNTTNYSRLFFYEDGTEKGVIQYINSAFSGTSRRNKLELANAGGIDFITTGTFASPDFQLLNTGAAYFKGTVQASGVGIGAVPITELYLATGTIRVDGTNPTLYLRGGSAGQKGRITLNHYGYYSYDIVVGDAANGMFSIGRTGETPVFNIASNNRSGFGTTTSNALLQLSSNYGGGTGDYTDITDAPLKIVGLSGATYWRIPHISTSAGISGVYNYQTGKDVYWGEPDDTGYYRFRGRSVLVGTTVSGGGLLQVNGDVNINGNFKINGTIIGGGGGSGVTGSGTSGYVTKWTGTSTLGNSSIYLNGSYVGINNTAAAGYLQVNNSSSKYLIYDTNGNLELWAPEDVTSYIRIGAAYGMKGVYSGTDLNLFAANGDMTFRKNNTVEFARFFSNTYNLSIGTSSDLGYRLNVSGDVNITGNYRINGTLLGSGIGGSGTSGYIPRFVSTTGLGNSTIQDNGTYATLTSTTYVALSQNIIWKGTSGTTYDFSMGNGGYGMYILSAAEIDLNAPIGMRYGLIYTFKGNGSSAYNVNLLNSGISADELTMLGGLKLSTTTASFIPPKMTTTQKNALASTGARAVGSIVYDTTSNLLQCWNGSSWNNLW